MWLSGLVNRYRTILAPVGAEIEVKRSVFRCQLAPISDEAAAREVIEQARSEFWDARHHCSAFIWQADGSMARSSDDGEPSGTAGAPMLEVLRGSGLTEVVAVVTRWFGGTLLGAGGLVRAYSDAVRAGLEAATVRERELVGEHEVRLDHALAARAESALRAGGTSVLGTSYGRDVTMTLGIRDEDLDQVEALLASLSHGGAELVRVGSRWVDC